MGRSYPAFEIGTPDTVGVSSRLYAHCSMPDSDRPQSPFAGMADFSARTPLRVLSPDEIERMLAEHRLYLETEYYQGHRANFSSADLARRDFSGLNLRGIKMDGRAPRG